MVLPQTVSKALKCSGPDLPNRSFKGNGYPTVRHTVLFCSFFNSNISQGLWWNASFEKASRSSACSPVPCGSHGAGAFSGACWVLLSSDFLLAQSCWPLPAPVSYQSQVGFCLHKTWLPSASAELYFAPVQSRAFGSCSRWQEFNPSGRLLVRGMGTPGSSWV